MHGLIPTLDEWKRGVRYAIIAITIGVGVWKVDALLAGLLPFALAFGISVAIEPIVNFLTKRLGIGRGWSALGVILVFLLVGWLVVAWATGSVIVATAEFMDEFPQYRETVVQFVQDLLNQGTRAYQTLPPEITRWITENTSRLAEGAEQVLSTLGRTLLGLLRTVPGLLTAGLLIPLATFFISKDLPNVKRRLWSLVPEGERPRVGAVMGDLWAAAWNYLRAAAILVTITTVVATVGLVIVGVENWFAAGLLVGVLDFLPVLGPTVVFLPWIAYLIIVGNVSMAISLLVVYAVAVGLRSLVEAKVIGDSIGLPPLAILLAMYLGVLLLGVKGAVLGPLLLLVSKAVYKAWQSVDSPTSPR